MLNDVRKTMPQVLDARTRRRNQMREDILQAAWRRAESDGIAGLSLRDLAADVGMRAPSLYTYFDGKAAIYDAMFAQGYRELDDLYAQVQVDPRDPVGSLTAGLVQFLRFCQASVPRYQLMFTRVVPDWQPSTEAYAVSLDSYQRIAAMVAPAGIDTPRGLDLWTALGAGLAAQQLANDPTGERWIGLTRDVVEMFLDHLGRTS